MIIHDKLIFFRLAIRFAYCILLKIGQHMWESYAGIVRQYPKVSLAEERRLISKAQKGSKKSKDEIVLRHIGFLIFRIHKITFPALIWRFGEDLLEEAILITYKKIETYDLNYCDKKGNPNPVKFVSYIWKRIDGFVIDYLKKEINEPHLRAEIERDFKENRHMTKISYI